MTGQLLLDLSGLLPHLPVVILSLRENKVGFMSNLGALEGVGRTLCLLLDPFGVSSCISWLCSCTAEVAAPAAPPPYRFCFKSCRWGESAATLNV